jgi:hypothetical protein
MLCAQIPEVRRPRLRQLARPLLIAHVKANGIK